MATLAGWAAGRESGAEEPPNVLLIMADDLGWMDLGCQGNERIETPNLDRLATQGMRFTDAYSAAPVCSPTRASILTGQSPARLNITNHIPDRPSFWPDDARWLPPETLDHLPLEHVTLAERLRAAGYATAFLGKWHLSGPSAPRDEGLGQAQFAPEHQGFDLNVGGCDYGGPPTFFDPYRVHNLPSRDPGEYLPDRLADEAIAFLREHRDGPFLLCLWNYAVHWPMEAPAELIEKYRGREGPGLNEARYGAMVEALDAALGRVFAALDDLDLARRTLVIFISDNGPYLGVADAGPLRAGKGYLYEGGIRVPLIVRWPGQVEAGTTCDTPVVSTDLFPTLLEAAGVEVQDDVPLDGVSLLPLLRGTGGLEREALFFHYPNYAWHRSNRLGGAVRAGRYKLIERYDDGSLELYDLEENLGETRNLAGRMPQKASELRDRLKAWRAASGARMPVERGG